MDANTLERIQAKEREAYEAVLDFTIAATEKATEETARLKPDYQLEQLEKAARALVALAGAKHALFAKEEWMERLIKAVLTAEPDLEQTQATELETELEAQNPEEP